ncbi:hypothetical protein DV711_15270 [Motiliproteus coralliicola]|uniref:Uncharacterized protein n=1 Tax=Motiliproteus coralliicola TaxID=2283196 RepID=A0A369WBD4_9GAMM|nr:hypothetical protein [Motiliproteus coralliicola]RDE18967.1 hypothetical protein DV711_15270 [Motiliproteus coralliicola]
MAFIISDTSTKNQKAYSFDSTSKKARIDYTLVEIKTRQYDYDGAIILTPETLYEIKKKNVAIFKTKKSAKEAYNKLGISTCNYVELVLNITHEYRSRNFVANSSWTELNHKIANNAN